MPISRYTRVRPLLRFEAEFYSANQGGTAKYVLSPLLSARAFFYFPHQKPSPGGEGGFLRSKKTDEGWRAPILSREQRINNRKCVALRLIKIIAKGDT